MPELPDIVTYLDALDRYFRDQTLERIRLVSPFLLRSVEPPLDRAHGRRVLGFRNLGKRVVWELEGDLFLVFHLMIAGRFHLKKAGAKTRRKFDLAAFDFAEHSLFLTEAGTKKRASLHLIHGASALAEQDPGGLDLFQTDLAQFRTRLQAENRTLKRRLTDPRQFSGIGNAFSDEILHAARLSPFKRTQQMTDEEIARLFDICRSLLQRWTERLKTQVGKGFPEKVTAFREDFAVHGRYGQPCPDCGKPVQRIVHAENESNYCAACQTGGRMLSDRALARLLQEDWPRTLDEWEGRMAGK
ncbi:DNA-(apurinic or apyrimidinic site) lyase [Sulfidibacter corallicola]|uniref:DNA-(apurinic or apyrimidinic site) lyase n=1 Tax=Sulfidibacter corallicola TaxID=2818388 RepID=A0A8A4TWK0_SULCO|nr:DNA-formamidopyrimidine glycosylase family protein [Sulfidibacter corallicola]QTD53342.1 hypothetical protein J3U87_12880 [Sulfidibacter corallicola]